MAERKTGMWATQLMRARQGRVTVYCLLDFHSETLTGEKFKYENKNKHKLQRDGRSPANFMDLIKGSYLKHTFHIWECAHV